MSQDRANRKPWTHYRMGPSPTSNSPNRRVEKFRFQISANRLEVVKNVNRTHFRTHRLVVKWCNEQSTRVSWFRQSHNWVKADRAQYVWSSCGRIAIVVMTLLFTYSRITSGIRRFVPLLRNATHRIVVYCETYICSILRVIFHHSSSTWEHSGSINW